MVVRGSSSASTQLVPAILEYHSSRTKTVKTPAKDWMKLEIVSLSFLVLSGGMWMLFHNRTQIQREHRQQDNKVSLVYIYSDFVILLKYFLRRFQS